MTKPRHPGEREGMVETLQRRQGLLRLMIDSHLRWMQAADDEQVRAIHRNLVDLLVMVAEQYDVLLNALRKPR